MIIEHVSVREEVLAIQEALELLSFEAAVAPQPGMKSRIWNELREEAPVVTMHPSPQASYSNSGRTWLAYAASFALIFSAASVAIFFYSENRKNQDALSIAQRNNREMKNKMLRSRDSLGRMALKMNMLSHTATKKVDLAGVPTSKDSKAVVFWNKDMKMVLLTQVSLPDVSPEKQYQLWALVDGVPVDAGVFDYKNGNGMLEMKQIDQSQAFAITLEPKGGSASPHLDALCVIGNVI